MLYHLIYIIYHILDIYLGKKIMEKNNRKLITGKKMTKKNNEKK